MTHDSALIEARAIISALLNEWPQDSVPSGPLCVRASRCINAGNPSFLSTLSDAPQGGEQGVMASHSQPCGDASALPDDDWVEWKGGENPAPGERVDVKYRNGDFDNDCDSRFVDWGHPWNIGEPDPDYDVIAYRILPSNPSDTGKASG